MEVKGGSGSVFGAWFGKRFSVDAIASYGSLTSDISRHLFVPSNNNGCVPACPTRLKERALGPVPLQQLGAPEEITESALFLVSDRPSFTTGQVLIDGGLHLS